MSSSIAPHLKSPTHDAPRISAARFAQLLASKSSPALPEAGEVYEILLANGVEPAFALAQFRVESQYGTAGYARVTGSWGNMLWDASLCKHANGRKTFGKYTYATYANYKDAITDYCAYLADYRDDRGLPDLYGATAEWIGKKPGIGGHLNYVATIRHDMLVAQYAPGTYYEVGDMSVWTGDYIDKTTGRIKARYPITVGMSLYDGTRVVDGMPVDLLKRYEGKPGDALFFGFVNGSPTWGTVLIGTTLADPKGTELYVYKPDKSKIKIV